MHGVGGQWTTHLPGYAGLRAHHLDHHRHPGRNFGTVFGSLMDRICGTRPGGLPASHPPPEPYARRDAGSDPSAGDLTGRGGVPG